MSAGHWDDIFATRRSEDLGWYEALPSTLVDVLAVSEPEDSVIDVGAGTGHLVDHLLAAGYNDLTLIDVSSAALDEVRRRLGNADASVQRTVETVVGDIADLTDLADRTWRVWHDRAVFHFMADPDARDRYRAALGRALEPGGVAVIATFAADGPESCAGLPVSGYDEAGLAAEFAAMLDCLGCRTKAVIPSDTDRRPYTICRFRKPEGASADVRPAA